MRFNATTTGLLRAQKTAHQQWRALAAQGGNSPAGLHATDPEGAALTMAWMAAYRIGQKALAALEAEAAEAAERATAWRTTN